MRRLARGFLSSLLLLSLMAGRGTAGTADPLPSWNDGAAKQAVLSFVSRVSMKESAEFVPEPERVAVFDNDGTLWPENPAPFQLLFVVDELKRRAPQEPALAADSMVQAALAGRWDQLLAGKHHDGLFHVLGLTHMGMPTDEFARRVADWFATARHPRFGVPYGGAAYQPMLELLTYLRAKGFKTWIVSGGGADFMRVFSERTYGIPPEQVVGSNSRTQYELRGDQPVLVKTAEHLFVDDKEGKPVAIHQFIGRRPIACFGNSDGDKAMLEYTTVGNPRPSFGLLVHHTDAEREYAYDAKPASSGKLVEALADAPKRGWVVVDMKQDWKVLWPSARDLPPSGK